jgi:Zn-finger nucleic acid-binding protein
MERHEEEVFGPNIEIDVCPKCNGTWLDRGELKKVLGDRKLSDYLTKHIGTKTESKLVCPRCGNLMDIEDADGIEVDVCLNCRGAWLDTGELKDLEAKSEAGFEGDLEAKALEREEERELLRKRSALYRMFGRTR